MQPAEPNSVVIRVRDLEVDDVFVLFGTHYRVWKIEDGKIFYTLNGKANHWCHQTFFKNSQQKIELIFRKPKPIIYEQEQPERHNQPQGE